MDFLSDRNIEMHKQYLNTLILRYQIFEKSYRELVGKDISGIYRSSIPLSEKANAAKLFAEIEAHKIYFSSFSNNSRNCLRLKEQYGSIDSFLFEAYKTALDSSCGFLFVYEYRGALRIYAGAEYIEKIASSKVILALDLCEHAYFYDYGFNREKYFSQAISHFDLSKCEKSVN